MSKAYIFRQVLLYETVGFLLIIAAIWANELLDIPHALLGAPATPINWQESLSETILVAALGSLVLWFSQRFLMRIRYLEGFLPVCSFCKKIRVGEDWVPIEEFIRARAPVEFSHSLCPECREEHYGEFLRSRKNRDQPPAADNAAHPPGPSTA